MKPRQEEIALCRIAKTEGREMVTVMIHLSQHDLLMEVMSYEYGGKRHIKDDFLIFVPAIL